MHKGLKTLCVFIFMSAVLLGGCGEKNREKAVASEFTANFSANYANMIIKGKLSSNSGGLLNLVVTSPETISGLCVNYRGNELQIKREELICSADEAYIPQGSFPSMVKAIVGGIAEGRASFSSRAENDDYYTLRLPNEVCTIDCSHQGEIKSIRTNSGDLYIEFFDFKVGNNSD